MREFIREGVALSSLLLTEDAGDGGRHSSLAVDNGDPTGVPSLKLRRDSTAAEVRLSRQHSRLCR